MNNDSKHQDYLTALFAVVDQFFKLRQQPQCQGRPKKYSDALILKLMLLMHLCRLDGETHLLRHVQRHYQQWFPILPSQSRLWHRIRQGLLIWKRASLSAFSRAVPAAPSFSFWTSL